MPLTKQTLVNEFPEHHHTIRHLKMHNAHFAKLLDSFHEIEGQVYNLEKLNSPVEDEYLETLKKRRLSLKDDLFHMIKETEDKL